jgi:hypothetical protein
MMPSPTSPSILRWLPVISDPSSASRCTVAVERRHMSGRCPQRREEPPRPSALGLASPDPPRGVACGPRLRIVPAASGRTPVSLPIPVASTFVANFVRDAACWSRSRCCVASSHLRRRHRPQPRLRSVRAARLRRRACARSHRRPEEPLHACFAIRAASSSDSTLLRPLRLRPASTVSLLSLLRRVDSSVAGIKSSREEIIDSLLVGNVRVHAAKPCMVAGPPGLFASHELG